MLETILLIILIILLIINIFKTSGSPAVTIEDSLITQPRVAIEDIGKEYTDDEKFNLIIHKLDKIHSNILILRDVR